MAVVTSAMLSSVVVTSTIQSWVVVRSEILSSVVVTSAVLSWAVAMSAVQSLVVMTWWCPDQWLSPLLWRSSGTCNDNVNNMYEYVYLLPTSVIRQMCIFCMTVLYIVCNVNLLLSGSLIASVRKAICLLSTNKTRSTVTL